MVTTTTIAMLRIDRDENRTLVQIGSESRLRVGAVRHSALAVAVVAGVAA